MASILTRLEELEKRRNERAPASLKTWVEYLQIIAELEARSKGETWSEDHEGRLVARARAHAERGEQIPDTRIILQVVIAILEEELRRREEEESAQT